MNKTVMIVLTILATVAVNVGAIPLAFFSLFGTAEGTSIFSIDYLIFTLILVLANLIVVQLFMAIKKDKKQLFAYGLIVAIIEVVFFVLFYNGGLNGLFFLIGSVTIVLAAFVLLVKSIC